MKLYYTAINGNTVEINGDDKVYKYPKEALQGLITCPITDEYFKEPVLLHSDGIDAYPYEKSAITKWLRVSNVDPLNEDTLPDQISIHKFKLLKFIMNCLEEKEDHFVFHSPMVNHKLVNDIVDAQHVGVRPNSGGFSDSKMYAECLTNTPIGNVCNMSAKILMTMPVVKKLDHPIVLHATYTLIDFSSFLEERHMGLVKFNNCTFTDCYVPPKIRGLCDASCKFVTTLNNFTIEELFGFDVATSKILLSDHMLSTNGMTITSNGTININRYLAPFFNAVSANMRMDRIVGYDLSAYGWYFVRHVEKKKEDVDELRIETTSYTKRIVQKAAKVRELIDTMEDVRKGYQRIQSFIDKQSEISDETMMAIKQMQKAMKLPTVFGKDARGLGRDYSFLDLSHKKITVDVLKHDVFCYTNLNGAQFTTLNFCNSHFVKASMLGTDFKKGPFCESHYPVFIDVIINDKTLATIKPEYHKQIKGTFV